MLRDNEPTERYYYLLTTMTGWRANSFTSSNITVMLVGADDVSEAHLLRDQQRTLFKRGAENWFLISTTCALGNLTAVNVWHNCSGLFPAWYVTTSLRSGLFPAWYVTTSLRSGLFPAWYVTTSLRSGPLPGLVRPSAPASSRPGTSLCSGLFPAWYVPLLRSLPGLVRSSAPASSRPGTSLCCGLFPI